VKSAIIDNRGEEHEWLLIFVTITSFLTFRKIPRLEAFHKKLRGTFKPY
jgi:hypothetical protein